MGVGIKNMKRNLTRLIAGSLSVLMMATSVPITSFAVEGEYGSNAGGDQSQTHGASATGTKFRAVHQGLRFTIVDRNMHAVSNSVDFLVQLPQASQYGNMLNTSYKFMNSRGDSLARFVEKGGYYVKEGTDGSSPTDKLVMVPRERLKQYLDKTLDELGDFQKADGTPLNTGLSTELSGFVSNDGNQYFGEDIKTFLMRGDIVAEGEVGGGGSSGGEAEPAQPPDAGGNQNKPSDGGNKKPNDGGNKKPSGGGSSKPSVDDTVRGYVAQAKSEYSSYMTSSIKAKRSYATYINGLGDLQSKWINKVNSSGASASVKNDTKLQISKLWNSYNDRNGYASSIDAQTNSEAPKKTTNKKPDTSATIAAAVNSLTLVYNQGKIVNDDAVAKQCNSRGLGYSDRETVKSKLKAKGCWGQKPASKSKKTADNRSLLDKFFGVMTVYAAEEKGPGGGSGNDHQPNNGPDGENGITPEDSGSAGGTGNGEDNATVPDGFETVKNEDLLYTANGEPFNGWLYYILKWQPDGSNYLFDVGGEDVVDYMVENDYLVMVEPLIYSNYKGSTWNSGETIYGTLSNIVEILGQEGRPNYIIQSYGPNYAYNALKLRSNYETEDGRTFTTSDKVGWRSIAELYDDYKKGGNTISGSMMQLYSTASFVEPSLSSSINTWDKENYPEQDGPSPDPSGKEEETDYGDNSKRFKIVKYYEQDEGEGYKPWSYYGVEENPHKVVVQNEENYRCIEYFTSTKDESYPKNGEEASKYVYSEQKAKYGDGQYKGNGPGTVTVKKDDKEVVLHVLLRFEFPQQCKIIKVYESDGVTDKVKSEDVEIKDGKYPVVTPDSGYNYTESTQVTEYVEQDPGSWSEVPQDNHSVETVIPVPETTGTVYIHYVQGGGTATPIILYENEISHNFSTAQLVENKVAINWNFPDKSGSGSGSHGSSDDRWHCDWWYELDDSNYKLEVANGFNYGTTSYIGSGGVFIGSEAGKVSTSNTDRGADINGFTTEDIVPEWKFVGYRDHSKDKVTLYPNKNDAGTKGNLSLLGISAEGSKPAGTRADTKDSGNWYNTFQTGYDYTGANDKYLSSKRAGDCTGKHGKNYGRYSGTESATAQDLNTAYSSENNMKTYYFLGEPNSGLAAIDTTNYAIGMLGKTFNKYMSSNTKNEDHVMFYPYIKMKYQTFGSGDSDVYVTSENVSDILIANRAEVGFYKEGSAPNLQLESTQWSTHSKSLAGLSDNGISDKNSVLPGGAALTLKAGQNGTKTMIGVRTYQTVVPDGLKVYLADGSKILTQSEAEDQYSQFIADAKDVLEHYQVVQWVTKGMSKNISEFEDDSNRALVSGNGAVTSFEGQQLAKDSKYYLKVDGREADRADIDILSENSVKTVWTIKSDTDGNVTVDKNGTAVASINATQGVGLLLQNAEIKLLNDKTKLVENYIAAIDRNKGRTRDNKKWYNEAFDGLSVICNEWEAELGFSTAEPVRSTILDTKLCGIQNERRDAYNFDKATIKDKVRTSIFMTSTKSTSSKAAGKPEGYLGSLGEMQIRINGIEEMFASKPFYIPNATVTDLN